MTLSLIMAMDKNGGIGKDNKLPWKLQADMHYFKLMTMGNIVVMGRKTYESIGYALHGRTNIILSRTMKQKPDDVAAVYSSVTELMRDYDNAGKDSGVVFVIGGSEIYKLFEPLASVMFVTHIHEEFDCDTFFHINHKVWKQTHSINGIVNVIDKYPHDFVMYTRSG